MRKVFHHRRRNRNTIVGISIDKNEQFIVKKCASYLDNLLNRYNLLDDETFDFLNWILGPDMEKVGRYLHSRLPEPERENFAEELLESEFDSRTYYKATHKIMKKSKKSSLPALKGLIQTILKSRIKKLKHHGASGVEKNLSSFKTMFNLTDQEVEFAFFFFIIDICDPPSNFFDSHLHCDAFLGRKYLATLLQISQRELNQILAGTLSKIGFFEMDQYIRLNDDYRDLIQNTSRQTFSKNFFTRISRKAIPLESHLIDHKHTDHVLKLFSDKPKTSTHILLYGSAGTGKTSYAIGLAEKAGIPAYEIISGDDNKTRKRRAAITAALNMTNQGDGSLIVVDEADNVLNTRHSYFLRGETQDKGWLNQILEEPGARIIWITNSISGIEDSVLRRFSFSLHFRPFNRRQRIQLWQSILRVNRAKRHFSQSDIVDLARRFKVSAGAIDLAVKKARDVGATSGSKFRDTVIMALDAHKALHNNGKKQINKNTIEKNYSLEGLNIEGNLETTMSQLEAFDRYLRQSGNDDIKNMNLLFYGPPGTGKSELARYIANHLDREIIAKRASDIFDKYVGETEQKIRKAFEKAENEEAILIIDEVDTLLFSRGQAQRSWEISFTNEFLTQMERFRGILICTTNRLKGLDDASIRRFNHKLGFNFLKPEGNIMFYRKLLAPLTNTPLDEPIEESLKSIPDLAPGDFRIVRDRFSFYAQERINHDVLLQALEEEVRVKSIHKNGRKRIGF